MMPTEHVSFSGSTQ